MNNIQRHRSHLPPIFHNRYSGFCFLCETHILGSFKHHWQTCWSTQRLITWRHITAETLSDAQTLYILSGDHIRLSLHTLNNLVADGDQALLQAGLVFVRKWQDQEKRFGNNRYKIIVEHVHVLQNVFLKAVKEQILSVFSHFGMFLAVILAIEDAFWALGRKIEFNDEENCWLMQWLAFEPWEDEGLIEEIKERFLKKFVPMGRPRKSRRVLRRKLWSLGGFCRGYEYSAVGWTQELDICLLRAGREFGSVEERVYAVVGYCYVNDLRWRSSGRILERMRVLGCGEEWKEEEEVEEGGMWEIVRGRKECLDVFKSRRRASI